MEAHQTCHEGTCQIQRGLIETLRGKAGSVRAKAPELLDNPLSARGPAAKPATTRAMLGTYARISAGSFRSLVTLILLGTGMVVSCTRSSPLSETRPLAPAHRGKTPL